MGLDMVINTFIAMDHSLTSDRYSENQITISHPIEPGIKTTAKPSSAWPSSAFGGKISKRLDGLDNLAEYVANCRAKDRQNNDDHDGDQNQNQRVLY
jgi:hypothetical protein